MFARTVVDTRFHCLHPSDTVAEPSAPLTALERSRTGDRGALALGRGAVSLRDLPGVHHQPSHDIALKAARQLPTMIGGNRLQRQPTPGDDDARP